MDGLHSKGGAANTPLKSHEWAVRCIVSVMMTQDPDDLPRFEDYQLPGAAYLGEPTTFVSVHLPESVLQRVNGAARFAGDTGKIDGLTTRTDLLRLALHGYLTELEHQYNGGRSFPAPASVVRGRGVDRLEPWVKIGVRLPQSLWTRVQGAAAWALDTNSLPGLTRLNQLTARACADYVVQIEQEHNRGKAFQDPRARRRNLTTTPRGSANLFDSYRTPGHEPVEG